MFDSGGPSGNIGGKRNRQDAIGDVDITILKEQYRYTLKQYTVQAIERHSKRLPLAPFDRVFLLWLSFYEQRDERHVHLMFNSNLRVAWEDPDKLLCSFENPNDVQAILSRIDDLLNSLVGQQEAARAEELDPAARAEVDEELDAPSQFWRIAKEYLLALQVSRGTPEAALEQPIEDMMLELIESHRLRIHGLVAQLKAMVTAGEEDSRLLRPSELQFYRAAAAMADVVRWSHAVSQFHMQFFLGEESVPQPPEVLAAMDAARQQDPKHIMTAEESMALMNKDGSALDADEEVFTEEILKGVGASPAVTVGGRSGPGQAGAQLRRDAQPMEIVGYTEPQTGDPGLKKKPQRFAKVKTGFHWNQYNRAHYDTKNPPPKIVMAYEFTLFYPDIVDSKYTPTYHVHPTGKGRDDEHCLITFSCPGGIYEDVTYRIVNKPWDNRSRRCTFDSYGKFRLFFRFQMVGYRR